MRRAAVDTAALSCFVGLVVFVTVLAAEHLLHPGLEPRDHRISEYVNASGGWLMILGFAAWAVALAAGALIIMRCGVGPARVAVAAGVALAAIGILAVGVFPTQTSASRLPEGGELTWTGRAHDLGSAASFVALTFAASVGALSDPALRRAAVIAPLIAAGLTAVTFTILDFEAPGIRQRVLVLGGVLWLAAAANILAGRAASK